MQFVITASTDYGGDFFDAHRSQWDPETLAEELSDGETIRAMFARENARARRSCEAE